MNATLHIRNQIVTKVNSPPQSTVSARRTKNLLHNITKIPRMRWGDVAMFIIAPCKHKRDLAFVTLIIRINISTAVQFQFCYFTMSLGKTVVCCLIFRYQFKRFQFAQLHSTSTKYQHICDISGPVLPTRPDAHMGPQTIGRFYQEGIGPMTAPIAEAKHSTAQHIEINNSPLRATSGTIRLRKTAHINNSNSPCNN